MDASEEPARQQDDASAPAGSRRFGLAVFGRLSSALLRLWGATWRLEVLGHDPRRDPEAMTGLSRGSAQEPTHLAAFFHESLLPAAFCFRDLGYSVAISRSRDGDLIEATLRGLGYADAARGSSSRGGSAALLALVRKLEAGTTVSVLVDGPRGPARVSKEGIIALARLTRRPIQPIAFSARPALRLGSWDQSLVPLPFARVVCAFGEPIEVPLDEPPECSTPKNDRDADPETVADEDRTQSLARRLDRRLVALHHEADEVLLTS